MIALGDYIMENNDSMKSLIKGGLVIPSALYRASIYKEYINRRGTGERSLTIVYDLAGKHNVDPRTIQKYIKQMSTVI